MRDVWLKIAHTSGARIYNVAAGFASVWVMATSLGKGGFGTYVTLMRWVTLFAVVMQLSLGASAIRYAVESKGRNWLGRALGSLLTCAVVLTVIGWLAAFLIYRFGPSALFAGIPWHLAVLGFVTLPFLVWEQYGSRLLMAADRLGIYNNAQIMGRTAGLLAVVVAWVFKWGVPGMLAAALLSQIIIATRGIGCLWRSASAHGRVRPDGKTLKTLLVSGLKIHWGAAGSQIALSLDTILVNAFAGKEQAGVYGLAKQLIIPLKVLPEAASRVLVGRVAEIGPDRAWCIQRRVLKNVMGWVVAAAAFGVFVAPWVVPALFGADYSAVVPLFRIMALTGVAMALAALMSVQWIGRGWFWQGALVNLSAAAVGIVGCRLLVPRYGAHGAAWSIMMAFALSALVNLSVAAWCDRRCCTSLHSTEDGR